jgi:hypothetical protein
MRKLLRATLKVPGKLPARKFLSPGKNLITTSAEDKHPDPTNFLKTYSTQEKTG